MAATTAEKKALQLRDVLSPRVFERVNIEAKRTGKSHERVIDEAVKAFTEHNQAEKKLYCNSPKCRAFRPMKFARNRIAAGTREQQQLYVCLECGTERKYGSEVPTTL